jgi:serine/threonine protein kinase
MTIIADRYEVLNSLEKGGMGEVIICKDLHLQRKVVLKCLQY